MGVTSSELVKHFAEFAAQLQQARSVDETMALIVATAVSTMGSCDHASLSYTRGKQLISAASNDDIGPALDRLQTETQEGPCLDAIRTGQTLTAEDLAHDRRWPKYGPLATSTTPVRAAVATPLWDGNRVIGALNLFSNEIGTIAQDEENLGLATIVAAHSAPALVAALERVNMAEALRSRDVIGQAKGMMMVRLDVDEAQAFDILRRMSQRMNVAVRELALRMASERDIGVGGA